MTENQINIPIAELIRKKVEAATADYIRELPRNIHNGINQAVADLLGFEKNSWKEWKIDHCNNRKSLVSDFIGEKAVAEAEKVVREIITPSKIREILESRKETILCDFEDRFIHRLRAALDEAAESMAKKMADDILSKYTKLGNKFTIEFDYNDPNMKGPLHSVVLEDIVKKALNREEK